MDYFDLHCDTLTAAFRSRQSLQNNTLQIDLLRARCFDRYAQFFAVFVPDDMPEQHRWEYTEALLQQARQAAEKHDKKGLFRLLCAIENAAAIGGDLQRLSLCADLGVKYITITWNGSNLWGNGCCTSCEKGLTALGKQGVSQMNRLGIFPDVSHLNQAGFWDVLDSAEGAVLATHTACRALCDHQRNLTDEQITALAQSGGLIGLTLYPPHLGGDDFETAERHLVHLWEKAGEEHVAIGADLDGIPKPAGGKDILVIPRFYRYLCRKNYEERLLKRLFFGNCNDFFKSL